MRKFAMLSVVFVFFLSFGLEAATEDASQADAVEEAESLRFEHDILPIFEQHCFDCHGAQIQEMGLDLRTAAGVLSGSDNGAVVVASQPDTSLLLELVANGEMPPDDDSSLGEAEVELIKQWIEQGAISLKPPVVSAVKTFVSDEDRRYWAFQKPVRKRTPNVRAAHRTRTPIDAWLLARLEKHGLVFRPDADLQLLLRRAYFDLIGLPPSREAVERCLSSDSPDAFERELDRLLASPHYGERWGRHWLDVAGYVDTRLFDGDLTSVYVNEGVWRYRDYVIGSFNADVRYDEFITEQLAGDEMNDWEAADSLTPEIKDRLVATGYLRQIEDHSNDEDVRVKERYDLLYGVMETVSTSLLGLNMECARCHNHKYDPISQRDYYEMMACFEPALNVANWINADKRFLPDVPIKEREKIDEHNAQVDKEVGEIDKSIKELEEDVKGQEDSSASESTEPAADPPETKEDREKQLAELRAKREGLEQSRQSYGKIQALWDNGPLPTSRILRRGNYRKPGAVVQPGFLEVLSQPGSQAFSEVTPSRTSSSGRRLALARWITDTNGIAAGLAARVMVNRMWHHHFGAGIVKTLGNFGSTGSKPTHPELLDYLAHDFVEHGWSMKRVHRTMVSSSAFRQSSRTGSANEVAFSKDPGNELLWHMNLKRLEAEIVRDSVLAASGKLDRIPGGVPVMISTPENGMSRVKAEPTPTSHWRRSVYIFTRRTYPLRFLETLDFPIMAINCTSRVNSATVLQSFAFLNGPFITEHGQHLAERIGEDSAATLDEKIRLAYWHTLFREPTELEQEKCQRFLGEQSDTYKEQGEAEEPAEKNAIADLCQMLLSTSEFLYVE